MRSRARAASSVHGCTETAFVAAGGRIRAALGLTALGIVGLTVLLGAPVGAVAAACPNEAIRLSQGTTYLPDCRAFEKVTPADKGGVDIVGAPEGTKPRPLFRSSLDGQRFMFASQAGFAGTEGVSWPSTYLAVRGAGWQTRGLIPPQRANILSLTGRNGVGLAARVESSSPNLSRFGLTTRFDLVPGASKEVESIYVKDIDAPPASQYELVTPEGPGVENALSNVGVRPMIVGATPDMRFVLFSSAWPLTPDAPGQSFSGTYLYLWGPDGIELVSRAPNGSVMTTNAGTKPNSNFIPNAISPDGSRVFFGGVDASGYPLFMRDTVADTTVSVSAQEGWAYTGSADGNRILYYRNFEGGGLPGDAVVRYDATTESEELITGNAKPDYALAASKDLSRVYFLSAAEPVTGQPPLEGDLGIYLWDEGEVSYVARLKGGDPALEGGGSQVFATTYGGWPGRADAGTNSDGSVFALQTAASLTGYDSQGTKQVYRYDAEASTPSEPQVTCASCPVGVAPSGDARISAETMTSRTSSSLYSLVLPRRGAVSDDGDVFFQTPDSLDPVDRNGRIDVYEWSGGNVSLLSTGSDGFDAEFVDSSASGDTAFFITRGRLLTSDRDDLLDVYSSTVGGGFVEPPPPGEPCQGSACQGEAPSPPGAGEPGSAVLNGAGDGRASHTQCTGMRKRANRKLAKAKRVDSAKAKRKLRAQARTLKKKARKCEGKAIPGDGRASHAQCTGMRKRADRKLAKAKRIDSAKAMRQLRAQAAALKKKARKCNRERRASR